MWDKTTNLISYKNEWMDGLLVKGQASKFYKSNILQDGVM